MKIAIITAQGIGDGLQMMLVAHHLKINGHSVVVYNNHLENFYEFFKGYEFRKNFQVDDINLYDFILVEHDNSKLSFEIVNLMKKKINLKFMIFVTNYSFKKHGSVDRSMYCFDQKKSMLENIALATKKVFFLKSVSFNNGITIPKNLVHRKNKQDIAIHPTASHQDKSWDKKKFIKLAISLREKGFNPVFTLSIKERKDWLDLEEMNFKILHLKNLADLARVLYESYAFIGNDSGPAHLASCLKLPVIVIGKRLKNLKYWQPMWHTSKIISPSRFIPNLKFFRLREQKWKSWIGVKRIIKELDLLLKN
jgi:lipopolysaccharide heptosyltransferase III